MKIASRVVGPEVAVYHRRGRRRLCNYTSNVCLVSRKEAAAVAVKTILENTGVVHETIAPHHGVRIQSLRVGSLHLYFLGKRSHRRRLRRQYPHFQPRS
jgi:hypothetical protein